MSKLILDIFQQFRCEIAPYVGCTWTPILPDFIMFLLVVFLPLVGIQLFLFWSFIIGEETKLPKWVKIWAIMGVIYIVFVFIVGF